MEVDFMEQQGRLRNSSLLILLISCWGCNTNAPKNHTMVSPLLINKDEIHSKIDNGLLIINKKPFSGTLFSLFLGTTDTAELTSYLGGKENGEWKKYYP